MDISNIKRTKQQEKILPIQTKFLNDISIKLQQIDKDFANLYDIIIIEKFPNLLKSDKIKKNVYNYIIYELYNIYNYKSFEIYLLPSAKILEKYKEEDLKEKGFKDDEIEFLKQLKEEGLLNTIAFTSIIRDNTGKLKSAIFIAQDGIEKIKNKEKNPLNLEKSIFFIFAHEFLHNFLGHMGDDLKQHPNMVNYLGDLQINQTLIHSSKLTQEGGNVLKKTIGGIFIDTYKQFQSYYDTFLLNIASQNILFRYLNEKGFIKNLQKFYNDVINGKIKNFKLLDIKDFDINDFKEYYLNNIVELNPSFLTNKDKIKFNEDKLKNLDLAQIIKDFNNIYINKNHPLFITASVKSNEVFKEFGEKFKELLFYGSITPNEIENIASEYFNKVYEEYISSNIYKVDNIYFDLIDALILNEILEKHNYIIGNSEGKGKGKDKEKGQNEEETNIEDIDAKDKLGRIVERIKKDNKDSNIVDDEDINKSPEDINNEINELNKKINNEINEIVENLKRRLPDKFKDIPQKIRPKGITNNRGFGEGNNEIQLKPTEAELKKFFKKFSSGYLARLGNATEFELSENIIKAFGKKDFFILTANKFDPKKYKELILKKSHNLPKKSNYENLFMFLFDTSGSMIGDVSLNKALYVIQELYKNNCLRTKGNIVVGKKIFNIILANNDVRITKIKLLPAYYKIKNKIKPFDKINIEEALNDNIIKGGGGTGMFNIIFDMLFPKDKTQEKEYIKFLDKFFTNRKGIEIINNSLDEKGNIDLNKLYENLKMEPSYENDRLLFLLNYGLMAYTSILPNIVSKEAMAKIEGKTLGEKLYNVIKKSISFFIITDTDIVYMSEFLNTLIENKEKLQDLINKRKSVNSLIKGYKNKAPLINIVVNKNLIDTIKDRLNKNLNLDININDVIDVVGI